jgi:CO/xanthine dehydrogenase FAD-binding subunit
VITRSQYLQAASVDEAVEILHQRDDISVVAGGTDLVVGARDGRRALRSNLLGIHQLQELKEMEEIPDGGLRCGALVSHDRLATSPTVRRDWAALADSAALVGSPATRCTGTLGGNVANASPAMDSASPLLVFDTVVELGSHRDIRKVPLRKFLCGPGRTDLAVDELVLRLLLQPAGSGASGSAYVRLGYRKAMEIAVAGAAALVVLGRGRES